VASVGIRLAPLSLVPNRTPRFQGRPRNSPSGKTERKSLHDEAAKQLAVASDYVQKCGYHRRDEELAELQAVLNGAREAISLPTTKSGSSFCSRPAPLDAGRRRLRFTPAVGDRRRRQERSIAPNVIKTLLAYRAAPVVGDNWRVVIRNCKKAIRPIFSLNPGFG
jgi:hypothetical protein